MQPESYIYYPWIRIPDHQLVYSLLYQDRIKRIVPEVHSAEDQTAFHEYENVIRQYVGYDFIENADFYANREVVSNAFSELILDAHSSRYKATFSGLFGPGFEERFFIRNRSKIAGMFYFMYPDKLGTRAFETLLKVGWMKYDEQSGRCEVQPQLLATYMTALASGAGLAEQRPIFTDALPCENALRDPTFRSYFAEILPKAYTEAPDLQEFCVNFLFGSANPTSENNEPMFPLHRLLTVGQAARIRAGLESERSAFAEVIHREIRKAQLATPESPSDFLAELLKTVKEEALDYRIKLSRAVNEKLTANQRSNEGRWFAGLSIVFVGAGFIMDAAMSTHIPVGTGAGIAATGLSYLILRQGAPTGEVANAAVSSRESANMFLNHLWDIQIKQSTAKSTANWPD